MRLYAMDDHNAPEDASNRDNALARWLARAGYRKANAQAIFIGATVACVIAGFAFSQAYRIFVFRPLLVAISSVPGSAGDMLALVLQGGPWILFILSGFAPTLIVRNARRS